MAYTLGTLVTDLRNKLDDSNFDSTKAKTFINDSQRYIMNKYPFAFGEATHTGALTIDTYEYDLPPAIESITTFRFRDPSGEEIDITRNYLDIKEFDKTYPDPAENDSGKPAYWTIRDQNFIVHPKPDVAYTLDIRYRKKPTTLEDDADVPDVPEHFQEAIVLGALVRAHKFNDNYDLAAFEQSQLDEVLLDIKVTSSAKRTGPHIARVNGRRVL